MVGKPVEEDDTVGIGPRGGVGGVERVEVVIGARSGEKGEPMAR